MTLHRIERSFVLDRNADGVWLEFTRPRMEVRLFSARPLSAYSPTCQEVVRGVDATLRPVTGLSVGFSALSWAPPSSSRPLQLRASRPQWSLGPVVASAEHAWQLRRSPNTRRPRAVYASLDAVAGKLALSLEYKDYREFDLPFSKPPTLVPIHPISLLNRHTHLLRPDDERGYQFQATWSPADGYTILLNVNAGSDHAESDVSSYRETFLDLRYEALGRWATRVSIDDAQDRAFNVEWARTTVLEVERYVRGSWSVIVDFQGQRVRPVYGDSYTNVLGTINLSHSPDLSFALQADYSDKPGENRRWYPAAALAYAFQGRHMLTLTFGRRRAGLLCAGGVCTLAPDFNGVVLRLVSRF